MACFGISQMTLINTELLLTQYGLGAFETFSTRPLVWSHFLALLMIHIARHILIDEINFFSQIKITKTTEILSHAHTQHKMCAPFYRNKKVMAVGQEKIRCYTDEYQSGFFGWRALE